MDNVPRERDTDESPSLLAQHYQLLHETEVAEATRQRFARRRFLRRSALVVGGLAVVSGGAGALSMLYPTLDGQFGGTIDLGPKANFPAAAPNNFKLNQAGVFYQQSARAFIVHLSGETRYLLTGSALESVLPGQHFTRDADGSYWLALYQRSRTWEQLWPFAMIAPLSNVRRTGHTTCATESTWMGRLPGAWIAFRSLSTATAFSSIPASLSLDQATAILRACYQYHKIRVCPDRIKPA